MRSWIGIVFVLSMSVGCGESSGTKSLDNSKANGPQAEPSAPASGDATVAKTPEQVSKGDASKDSPSPTVNSDVAANQVTSSNGAKSDSLSKANDAKTGVNKGVAPKPKPEPTPEQVSLWALPDHTSIRLLDCRDGFGDGLVQAMAVSPDGKQIVLGGSRLTLWKVDGAAPEADLLAKYTDKELERPIRSVAISPDGKWLAAGDQRGTLRVWQLGDQSEVFAIKAHDGRLLQIAFSPDSQTIATTSYSGEVRTWQAADGAKKKAWKASSQEIAKLLFLDDSRLVTAGKECAIWNVDTLASEQTLTTGYVRSPAISLSPDRKTLAFCDAESKLRIWDTVQNQILSNDIAVNSAQLLSFSSDGKRLAINNSDSIIGVCDVATGQCVQVIDADGGRTSAIEWLPQGNILAIASERGRLRLWGAEADGTSVGITPIALPSVAPVDSDKKSPLSTAQLQNIVDLRTLPRLPGAESPFIQPGMLSYKASATKDEAEMFYRYILKKAGWSESTETDQNAYGLSFTKDGCRLYTSFTPLPGGNRDGSDAIQVGVNAVGNLDVRDLPKVSSVASKSVYESFGSLVYRSSASLTDIETQVLRSLSERGWTAYSRLNAATAEDPESTTLWLLQNGLELNVSARRPADSKDELAVQMTVSLARKSLPIPRDSGWIEFDSSSELLMVANTKMELSETVEFYDTQMAADGWLKREAGRKIDAEAGKAWLPYIRGQQDVTIRLLVNPNRGTRVLVGDVENASWQLQKPPAAKAEGDTVGIEAADLPIPSEAIETKFSSDTKEVVFRLPNVLPQAFADRLAESLSPLGWTRSSSGVSSEEYVLASFKQGKREVEVRARRSADGGSSVQISGDGLLWNKPLPTAPTRISYGDWLRRNRLNASLEHLDKYQAEMKAIEGK